MTVYVNPANEVGDGISIKKWTGYANLIYDETAVNTYQLGDQKKPDIALLNNGNAVIVWESHYDNSGTHSYNIFGKTLDVEAWTFSEEFLVSFFSEKEQTLPTVCGLQSGGFLVAWNSYGQDRTNKWSIWAKRYNFSRINMGNAFLLVNSQNDQSQQISL